ncbi:hypothetical protein LG58_1325 [Kosakonia radicincitans YD4]|nr:hypothetical protein LG58_1325 [Kosakonia radicincitans YD4]
MLTDTQCRTARPKEKLYRLNDFNGLYLEVKPNGKKAWRYRFKLNGKSSMFALGEYPTVKLAEAREKCEQARKLVADGVSPTQARQLDKIRKVNDASNTFELIAKEWLQCSGQQKLATALAFFQYRLSDSFGGNPSL